MATPTAATAKAAPTTTIVSTLDADAEVKLTKAQRRSAALSAYRVADDAAKVASDERKSTKDAALALCDDGKVYKDLDGHSYAIDKESESTDYSGTLKWALSSANPLDLDKHQLRMLQNKLEDSKKSRANSAPIKRLD